MSEALSSASSGRRSRSPSSSACRCWRPACVAGVLVSMFQTVTSIQDNVLAFIPRAAAIFAVFALTFPWMLRSSAGFSIGPDSRGCRSSSGERSAPPLIAAGLLLVRPGVVMALRAGSRRHATCPSRVKMALTVLVAFGAVAGGGGAAERQRAWRWRASSRASWPSAWRWPRRMQALVAGVELAGHLSGYQIGYSYGATIDPMSGVRNNTVTALFGLVAVLTLLSVNGHHAVLRALAASYEALPIGARRRGRRRWPSACATCWGWSSPWACGWPRPSSS